MEKIKRISFALVSVNNSTGLEPILTRLHELKVEFFIDSENRSLFDRLELPYTTIEELYPSDKIISRRTDMIKSMMLNATLCVTEEHPDALNFELLICDIDQRDDESARSYHRDSWVRSACRNSDHILTIASSHSYSKLEEILELHENHCLAEERQSLAESAQSILKTPSKELQERVSKPALYGEETPLAYGANPHQQASFLGDYHEVIEQLQGGDLSYDNLINLESGLRLLAEFDDITFIIMKHCNPCGVASHTSLSIAYNLALESNPLVAYGSILLTNAIVDKESAEEINKLNFELIIAPDYDFDALEVLSCNSRRKILILKEYSFTNKEVKSCLNGLLVQAYDPTREEGEMLIQASAQEAEPEALDDMQFALKIAKHSTSNAMVIVKQKQLLAIGTGQSSRVDALNSAFAQAQLFEKETKGAVLATDRHLPYGECLSVAAQGGLSAIVLPGGATNDDEIANTADRLHLALYFNEMEHGK